MKVEKRAKRKREGKASKPERISMIHNERDGKTKTVKKTEKEKKGRNEELI